MFIFIGKFEGDKERLNWLSVGWIFWKGLWIVFIVYN